MSTPSPFSMIYPPLKKAQHVWGQFHELVDLRDFLKCITQPFGVNAEYYGGVPHNGIDVLCPEGTEIIASHDGEAAYYEEKDSNGNFIGYGKYVSVRDRVNNFKTEYCHLSKVIKTGQVKAGEVIGLAGSTGNSTNPHLHWTLKNPEAIDPIPHLVWFEIMKLTKIQVLALQALEGYSDPTGAEYWSGKELSDYLKARAIDKIKELEKII